jgi:NADPH:quinone reductase-like Zn-dependent oxidoreductase
LKAIVYNKYGTIDVLRLEDVEKPAPKENEVLIKVHAASINSWDWDLLRGKPYLARIGGLFKPQYSVLGADIAGQVEAVGSNVQRFVPGDEVFGDISGCGWGGFAEYVSVQEHALTHKSARMTFEEAAAIPQAGVLALQGLRKGQLQHGHKLLINGAGGGVGTFALQFAKSTGAEVTVVDSTAKLDMLKSLGADHVIDYTKEDFTRNGHQYDLIMDVVGYRSIADYTRALSPKGTYVMIGGSTALIFKVMFLAPWISMTERKKLGILIHKPNNQDQNAIKELYEAGKVVPIIDRSYPLSDVAKGLQYLGEGHAKGKIIIRVAE